eukprot:snap_masked-scaffold_25-processed-gene-4.25-mRNA-1 protein AED:0.27 eAED:0.27 QI:174/1/1/1/1/1/2/59/422
MKVHTMSTRLLSTLRFSSSVKITTRKLANNGLFKAKPTSYGFSQLRCFSSDIVDVNLPPLADSIDSGTLASWEKEVGEFVELDDVLATVDTDKVTVDIKAPVSGELSKTLVEVDDEIKVGDLIAQMVPGEAPAKAPEDTPKQEKPAKTESAPQPTPTATPPKQDTPKPPALPKQSPPAATFTPPPVGTRSTHTVKLTPIRKKTAERLKEAQNTAASLTTFNEIDMTNLFALRNKYKDDFLKKHDVKLGFMSAFVAAAARTLQEIPVVNARMDYENGVNVFHDYVDISIAVSSPRGLVVPVLRNVESMSFLDIEKEIGVLAGKARNNALTLEDMSGGTFTVTNGGVFGSMMSTPMINLPQSAILGMHAVKERAVVVDGKVEVRPIMYVALTYDHRIIDGRESVTFLKSIKEKVEDPSRLLLNL